MRRYKQSQTAKKNTLYARITQQHSSPGHLQSNATVLIISSTYYQLMYRHDFGKWEEIREPGRNPELRIKLGILTL